jgi:hypothetical protein
MSLRVTTRCNLEKTVMTSQKEIVIARRYDEAIPKIQSGSAQLPCNVGDCFVPRNDGFIGFIY